MTRFGRNLQLLAMMSLGCVPKAWVGVPAMAAEGTVASAQPSLSAQEVSRHDDPAAGLDTLEDERDRSLPESREIGIRRGPADRERIRDSSMLAVGVHAKLGRGWTIEGRNDYSGPLVLRGPPTSLEGGPTAASVMALLETLPGPFGPGIAAFLESIGPRNQTGPGPVRFVQILDGARVAGSVVVAHFDERGALRSLESAYRPGLRSVNERKVPPQEAERIAWADLRTAERLVVRAGQPKVEAWVWPLDGGPGHVWIVRQPTLQPWGSFVTRVDAATGRVLSRENAAQSAIRTGSALVYRENADYPGNASVRRVRNLYGRARNPYGELKGVHFTILDDRDRPAESAVYRYVYHPLSHPDSFDQVSAYYHLERAHARFAERLGVRDLSWFDGGQPVAAVVNAEGYCGAFYSSDLHGDGIPGFVFGNQGTCEFQNEDFARDADVIYHEFAHAIADWKGLNLAMAPVDSYQRSISEADADYHSASTTGDPLLGEVLGQTRLLDNDKTYPEDVACNAGSVEEHCTGEIWGGLLWDLRSVLKGEAERLEFASLDHLVDHWPDGHVATWLDFWDATMALLRADQDLHDGAHQSLIYGAAASRGVFGPDRFGTDNVTPVYQRIRSGTKFKSVGWVHKPLGRVRYYFDAPPGREVSIRVRTTSSLEPAFLLGPFETEGARFLAKPAAATPLEASLEAVLPLRRTLYVLEVFGLGSSTGAFQVSIVVR